MTDGVLIALIVGVFSLPGLLIAYLNLRSVQKLQPGEIKASDAASDAVKANTSGDYIDNQNKLLSMFTAESLSKVELLNKFAALNLRVIEVEGQNATLKVEVAAVTRRAQAGEQSALDYKQLYEAVLVEVNALKLRTKDYPARILELETEVRELKKAAGEASESRLSDARTREVTANTAAQAATHGTGEAANTETVTPSKADAAIRAVTEAQEDIKKSN